MRTRKLFYVGAAVLAVALLSVPVVSPTQAGDQKMKLKIDLEGSGNASGNAKWEKRGTGSCDPLTADRCKASVEGEDFPSNTMVTITINCMSMHTYMATTDGAGFFDLNLDTDRGEVVKDCMAGNTVTVTGGGETIMGNLDLD